MSLRVVVVGSGGRLGAALVREWRARGDEVAGLDHVALDLSDMAAMRAALEPMEFDVLVNCAALTNVDYCEQYPEAAMRVNADAVGVLAEICAAKSKRCVQISTDYVFAGTQRTAYLESDSAEPISHYGRSKLAGEKALLEVWDQHLVVRVSWVFGPDRPSFIDGILKRATENEQVEAICDKIAVPTSSVDAATMLHPFLAESPIGGVLHLCNGGECSWQEYGQHALDCAEALGVALKARTVGALRLNQMKSFIARRPVYSAMNTGKLASLSGQQPRAWQEAVEQYVRSQWRRD